VPLDHRTRRLAAASVLALAVPLGAACAADPPSKGAEQMTSQTDTAQAHWDLSTPTTPTALGSRHDDVIIAETLGDEGVDTRITLPGGDVIEGMYRTVTAKNGRTDDITTVDVTSTRLSDGAWEPRIDALVERFGFDRAAIDADLATALPAAAAGDIDPQENFPGEPRPEYEPSLQLRPEREGVVLNLKISFTPA
jgi:hypothetical protein